MSTDEDVAKMLMQVLQDGQAGYAKAAEKVTETSNPELMAIFARNSRQRAGFYDEIQQIAAAYGDDIEESGTVRGTLHRGWMTIKDAFSGSDPVGILDTAEEGEDHAVEAYRDALDEEGLSEEFRAVLHRQNIAIRVAHDEIRSIRQEYTSK